MNQKQIELIQISFEKIQPSSTEFISLLYDRLFSMAPELRSLFRGDSSKQGKMLMAVLGIVFAGLGRFDKLRPMLVALGCRHATYGVEPAHYSLFGSALILTLETRLGSSFTPAVKEAWLSAYAELANVMINAVGDATLKHAGRQFNSGMTNH